MAKNTAKYKGAKQVVMFRGLSDAEDAVRRGDQEEVYDVLNALGFFWNSKTQEWEEHDLGDADDPTPLVMIRVWADIDIVEDAADDVARNIQKSMPLQLVQKSKVYQNRPPKQLEGRVYLQFVKTGEASR